MSLMSNKWPQSLVNGTIIYIYCEYNVGVKKKLRVNYESKIKKALFWGTNKELGQLLTWSMIGIIIKVMF